jgi:hypothetical protein
MSSAAIFRPSTLRFRSLKSSRTIRSYNFSHTRVSSPKSDSICVPRGCEFNFEYLRSPGKSLCLGIPSMGGGEARVENPLLPDQMGTMPSLPSRLLFSFGLELDTVDNYPYSDENLIRYTPDPSYPMVPFFSFLFNSHCPSRTFPAHLDRTSPSFPRLASCELTSYAFLLVWCLRHLHTCEPMINLHNNPTKIRVPRSLDCSGLAPRRMHRSTGYIQLNLVFAPIITKKR